MKYRMLSWNWKAIGKEAQGEGGKKIFFTETIARYNAHVIWFTKYCAL